MNTPADQSIDISHTYGKHECLISEVKTEDNLRTLYKNCEKNPGHTQFYPIKDFKMEHLPEGHRNTVLYECIKAVADLTVRVSVDMVSPHRPEFFPYTCSKVKYPFNGEGGNDALRTGTGEIEVIKFKNGRGYDSSGGRNNNISGGTWDRKYKTCPCEKCRHSDEPSNDWWEIGVHTAAHVVFDAIEASHTSCRLFFDEKGSKKVTLDQLTVEGVRVERDRCELQYVTCDADLGEKLYKMNVKRSDLYIKLLKKYFMRFTDKIIFIVTHPHGCPKEVSVGQWVYNIEVSVYKKGIKFTKLTYTTSTCPGSSGAMIYCPGLGTGHVHNGELNSQLNYSSVDYFL